MFLVLAGLFLGSLEMLNILGLTRFLQLGTIGSWPIVVALADTLPFIWLTGWLRHWLDLPLQDSEDATDQG